MEKAGDLFQFPTYEAPGRRLPGGGEPPTIDPMMERLVKLETILPTLATKADIAELRADMYKVIGDQTMKIVGWATSVIILAGGAFTAAVYFIARNVR